jgi:hypothetical protein
MTLSRARTAQKSDRQSSDKVQTKFRDGQDGASSYANFTGMPALVFGVKNASIPSACPKRQRRDIPIHNPTGFSKGKMQTLLQSLVKGHEVTPGDSIGVSVLFIRILRAYSVIQMDNALSGNASLPRNRTAMPTPPPTPRCALNYNMKTPQTCSVSLPLPRTH